jgi:predicted enzyme related to lactoylglutathione lyase
METFTQPLVTAVMVDCNDATVMMRFWGELLHLEEVGRRANYTWLGPINQDGVITLGFQQVDELKTAKNRIHLDMRSRDVKATVARIVTLGGSRVAKHVLDDIAWEVVADPEGNEFCVLPFRD